MKFILVYTNRAVKDIKQLDKSVKKRIGEKLLKLAEDPYALADKLADHSLGMFRCRAGEYRIIFDISDDQIVVLRIGHRREIYRKR